MSSINNKKALWYGPTILDNRVSKNVEDIRQSHYIHYRRMKNWKAELTAGGKSLAEDKFQKGIFQGVVPLPLQFVIRIMLLR